MIQRVFLLQEMREKIAPFIGHVEKDFWPKKLSHSQKCGQTKQLMKY